MIKNITLIATLLPAMSMVAAPATDYVPEIYASVYSANSWKEHGMEDIGMYRFAADRYERTTVMIDPYLDASGGGVMTEDFYFCTQELNYGDMWIDITHYFFDPETWTEISSLRDGSEGSVATDMTYDPTTDKVYGCFNGDGGSMVFGTLNVTNGERFAISTIDIPWIACSVDNNGNLYAVDMNGNLLGVNKINGETTLLGNLGFEATNRSTGAIDPRTGTFYVVVTTTRENDDPYFSYTVNVSHLWAVDIASATASCLYEFGDGEALGGMFIPGPVAPDGAPAQPEDLSVDFPKGSLTGSVNFTVPATTFDGEPATGGVNYLVRANGDLLAEGSATYGSEVKAPAKISVANTYDITVTLSNGVGRSPRARLKTWLGPDTPTPLTQPVLAYSDGAFNLSWTAPTDGEHGGYFDPELVTYTVTRTPGNVTVAENTTATSLTETMAVPDEIVTYQYIVTMNYDGRPKSPVSSNIWRLGTVLLPYHTDFEAENSLELFTRIDCNRDHIEWYREWEFYVEETDELIPVVCYPYSSSQPADDWLITPPVQFKGGKTYTLAYESLTDYLGDAPLLAIYMGEAPTVDGMTTELQKPTEITTLLPTRHTLDITVDHDGIYYIGFLACSEPYRSGIALTTINIEGEDSGIDNVTADAADDSYTVYTIDGRIAAQGHGSLDTTTLPAGLYIVKQGSSTRKLTLGR